MNHYNSHKQAICYNNTCVSTVVNINLTSRTISGATMGKLRSAYLCESYAGDIFMT